MLEAAYRCLHALGARGLGVITQGALEHGAAVGDLGGDHGAGDGGGSLEVVGAAVLLAAEEDVAGDGSLYSGHEAPPFGEEGDGDAAIGAQAHEERAARDLAEADDSGKGVNGDAQAGFLFLANEDAFPFFGEIGSLCGDEEGVQMSLHLWVLLPEHVGQVTRGGTTPGGFGEAEVDE